MTLLSRLIQHLPGNKTPKNTDPAAAYNLWAQSYDAQPGNLMLDLDEALFSRLLSKVSLKDKTIADIGCGTGRHWKKVLGQKPLALYGYDVSAGMLDKLKSKFPSAVTYLLKSNHLPQLDNECIDIIIATLTIAHIENINETVCEWSRVLKNTGEVIITDYHPEALKKGGKRTFSYNGTTVAIKNYIHTIEKILATFGQAGFESVETEEQAIDDSMKHYYEEKNALHVFEKFKNVPVIYGMRLRKRYVTS